eukprot:104760-Pleurochrysis_carterae.AAC.1
MCRHRSHALSLTNGETGCLLCRGVSLGVTKRDDGVLAETQHEHAVQRVLCGYKGQLTLGLKMASACK